jgi:cytochrome c553
VKAQLQAFASGDRHNDVIQPMRNIARSMTPLEIDQAAAYCESQPPQVVKPSD